MVPIGSMTARRCDRIAAAWRAVEHQALRRGIERCRRILVGQDFAPAPPVSPHRRAPRKVPRFMRSHCSSASLHFEPADEDPLTQLAKGHGCKLRNLSEGGSNVGLVGGAPSIGFGTVLVGILNADPGPGRKPHAAGIRRRPAIERDPEPTRTSRASSPRRASTVVNVLRCDRAEIWCCRRRPRGGQDQPGRTQHARGRHAEQSLDFAHSPIPRFIGTVGVIVINAQRSIRYTTINIKTRN